jgi:hypothetical protein
MVAVTLVAPVRAVIVALVSALTPELPAANVPCDVCWATVVEAGTVRAALELLRETTVPPGPANPFSPTVTCSLLPPGKVATDGTKLFTVAGTTVMDVVMDDPYTLAVTETAVEVDTPAVLN